MNLSQPLRSLAYLFILLTVCVATSLMTIHWASSPSIPEPESYQNHKWLHKELSLTPTESKQLDAFETQYRQEREGVLKEFNRRTTALAELLVHTDHLSSEVEHAIHDLHGVHGQLQELSIRHYYQMLSVLPEDKQAQLRTIAVEALSIPE